MKRILFLLLATSLFDFSTAFAAVSDEDLEQLRMQLAAVSERLEELAAENAELKRSQAQTETVVADVQTSVAKVQQSGAVAASETWIDRIGLSGDFRYRYENIDPEGSSTRDRNRMRARANVKADLTDDIEVGFGLASGGDDPVSTNQTLGGGGSSKGVVLNLAYADWAPTDGLHLLAGKYKNPLYKAGKQPLMWDGDWTPEGFGVTYQRDAFFLNAIGTFLESDTKNSNDSFAWGAQLGAAGKLGDMKLKGGVAYYSFKTEGDSTTFGDPGDPGDYFGNTAVESGGLACGTTPDTECTYLYDYLLTEVFAEASFELGGWPTAVFADYVNNSDPSDNDTAWMAGARFGQSKDKGQFQFSYYYADKEADSMLGLVTDSDFGGGGTDSKGHFLQLNFGVNKSWTIGAQYFINETDVASGAKNDYNRVMLDSQWKWK